MAIHRRLLAICTALAWLAGGCVPSPPDDADGDGHSAADGDCDDTDPRIHPGADETCDGEDNDCDGQVDEDDAVDALTWHADHDGDGYGNATVTHAACQSQQGYIADATDCDDTDADNHPGADETCDGQDNDCDGVVDEDDAVDAPTWHPDGDGDGYGGQAGTVVSCEAPDDYVYDGTDCDDVDEEVHPGAPEIGCDGVDNDCADGDAGTSVHDGGSIQDAIDGAASGEWICVYPGTYDEELVIDRTLHLIGVDGAAVTTVRGVGGGNSVVWIAGVEDVLVQGLTIRDGRNGGDLNGDDADGGAGILVDEDSHGARIDDCVVTGNETYGTGGGIYVHGADEVTLSNNEVTENEASLGGGGVAVGDASGTVVTGNALDLNQAAWGGGLSMTGCTDVTVTDNDLSDNTVREFVGIGGSGGGFSIQASGALEFSGNVVARNEADEASAGKVYSEGTAVITDSYFGFNSSDEGDAGLRIWRSDDLLFSDNVLEWNTAAGSGAGLFLDGANGVHAVVTGCTFDDNAADGSGGALYAEGDVTLSIDDSTFTLNQAAGHGGAVALESVSGASLSDLTFTSNTATLSGGGVMARYSDDLVTNGCSFESNLSVSESEYGGGLFVWESERPHVESSSFVGNVAHFGGGLGLSATVDAQVENNEFDSNEGTAKGGGVYFTEVTGATTLASNTLTSNTATEGAAVRWWGCEEATLSQGNVMRYNIADYYGGAVALGRESIVTFENDTMEYNSAYSGGSIFCSDSTFTCSGLTLSGNSPNDEPYCSYCNSCPSC